MHPVPAPALLLIDVQQGFGDPVWGPRDSPQAETRIAELLAAFRTCKDACPTYLRLRG